jgi:leucyl aminopeptidase
MGPEELQSAVEALAERYGARLSVTKGAELERDFPMIHAVGHGSDRRPRLLDLTWGKKKSPKVTLVGKGVCFDTGGLDLKPPAAMLNMKKDMGGAAMTIALADAIMALGLNVRLRLLVPAVENSVSGRSFRPGDVLKSRSGVTVEIGNTDAEGRLVLGDALDLADQEEPEIMIDAATLTGAARVALGPELPVLFSNSDALADEILAMGVKLSDPLWRLPLHEPYRAMIKSNIADINNAGTKPFAGAITAALFLQTFVKKTKNWAHLDIFGINDTSRPGRPSGGEACALRPLLQVIDNLASGGGK